MSNGQNAPAPEYGTIEYYDTVPNFWDNCDKVQEWLEAHPGRLYNCSTIKRGAKVEGNVYQVLNYLDDHKYIAADGNGAWRKYAARR